MEFALPMLLCKGESPSKSDKRYTYGFAVCLWKDYHEYIGGGYVRNGENFRTQGLFRHVS